MVCPYHKRKSACCNKYKRWCTAVKPDKLLASNMSCKGFEDCLIYVEKEAKK